MMRISILAVAIFGVASPARAGEIVLREQATPAASVVRLGDVANIVAAEGVDVDRLAATPLMPAPAPGTQHFLRTAELRDLLVARGVDLRGWQFTGAEVAAVGEAATAAGHSAVVTGATEVGDVQSAAEQLTAAIIDYLRQQTGHELWQVKVDADDDVVAVQRQAGPRMIVSGGKAPWSGRQRFTVAAGPGQAGTIAYARVERMEMAAFATRPIERGDFIRRSDIELRPHVGALPVQAISSLEAVVGKEAVQGIRADSLVMANQVRSPLIVRRGERVSVRARAEGISVRTYAVAQQDGSFGDLVMVESLVGKERFAARVAGSRELEVFAAGASAGDVAAAGAP